MAVEGRRNLVAHDIAQHTTKHPGDHAHEHRHDAGQIEQQGLVGARGRKKAQAHGVGHLDGPFGELKVAVAQESHGEHTQRQHAPEHLDMLNPEKRPLIEQQVAQRTAAKSGQETHHANTHGIQPFARRLR